MPSFADSIFLFVLALLLFGPKKLPVLARELGKWMGEFRRASNEFKMQMDEELRASEQADRQKQIVAMEAAAPVPPPLGGPAEPEHPHLRHGGNRADGAVIASSDELPEAPEPPDRRISASEAQAEVSEGPRPVPIATSGSLQMMPPATGLPTPRGARTNALTSMVEAIPSLPAPGTAPVSGHEAESSAHAD